MAIARHYSLTATTSAAAIPGTQYPGYILQNRGSAEVFIGSTGVTASTGFGIPSGGGYSPTEEGHQSLTGKDEDRLFAITASGTADLRVIIGGRLDR